VSPIVFPETVVKFTSLTPSNFPDRPFPGSRAHRDWSAFLWPHFCRVMRRSTETPILRILRYPLHKGYTPSVDFCYPVFSSTEHVESPLSGCFLFSDEGSSVLGVKFVGFQLSLSLLPRHQFFEEFPSHRFFDLTPPSCPRNRVKILLSLRRCDPRHSTSSTSPFSFI